jgi:hypothetical protein
LLPDYNSTPKIGRVLQRLVDAGLVKGKSIGIDETPLAANAALRSIVRRDTGATYQEFWAQLAQASGIETPTREELARLDRKRPKKGSNDEWTHPLDPDAKITKMKDGRTHLAHKAEHAVDSETGAVVAVTVQDADAGDTATSVDNLIEAAEQVETVVPDGEINEVVADKGYHGNQAMVDLERREVAPLLRALLPLDRGRRRGRPAADLLHQGQKICHAPVIGDLSILYAHDINRLKLNLAIGRSDSKIRALVGAVIRLVGRNTIRLPRAASGFPRGNPGTLHEGTCRAFERPACRRWFPVVSCDPQNRQRRSPRKRRSFLDPELRQCCAERPPWLLLILKRYSSYTSCATCILMRDESWNEDWYSREAPLRQSLDGLALPLRAATRDVTGRCCNENDSNDQRRTV